MFAYLINGIGTHYVTSKYIVFLKIYIIVYACCIIQRKLISTVLLHITENISIKKPMKY